MKLVYCTECKDIYKPRQRKYRCRCGKSWGKRIGIRMEIGGSAIPIGISNSEFEKALQERPVSGIGSKFSGYVLPEQCLVVKTQ